MNLFDYLQSAEKSLFRFEAFQEYQVEDEDLSDKGMKEWWDFVVSKVESGVEMHRVRLVKYPLTDYTKRELEVHKKSQVFGDDIRIIENGVFETLDIPLRDFWLIDDEVCLVMNYSHSGEYEGFDVVDDVGQYLVIKDTLLSHSKSFAS